MSSEVYEGLCARTGGNLTIGIDGAKGAGKTACIRAMSKAISLAVEEEAECLAGRGAMRVNEGQMSLDIREGSCESDKIAGYIVIVTDGSFGNTRSAAIEEEESCIAAIKAKKKPYVLILNSNAPRAKECLELCDALEEKYGAPVYAMDLLAANDFDLVFEGLLHCFPVCRIDINIPEWMRVLPAESKIVSEILSRIREIAPSVERVYDCDKLSQAFENGEVYCESCETDVAAGIIRCDLAAKDGMFYRVLSEESGTEIPDDLRLMAYVRSLKDAKEFYERYGEAFRRAEDCGYGVSAPLEEDMELRSPELYRRGTRCGVRLRADACTYHIIKVDVHSEVSPIAGESTRGEEIAKGMVESYEKDPQALWNTDMFGKTFKDMAREGLLDKTMPEDTRSKLRKALTRIVNEGKGGVICILL